MAALNSFRVLSSLFIPACTLLSVRQWNSHMRRPWQRPRVWTGVRPDGVCPESWTGSLTFCSLSQRRGQRERCWRSCLIHQWGSPSDYTDTSSSCFFINHNMLWNNGSRWVIWRPLIATKNGLQHYTPDTEMCSVTLRILARVFGLQHVLNKKYYKFSPFLKVYCRGQTAWRWTLPWKRH